MQVLLCGFDDATIDRLSLKLQEAGYGVLGASSEGSARSLAAATSPAVVFVPAGDPTDWIPEVLPDARVIPLEADTDPVAALVGSERPDASRTSTAVEPAGALTMPVTPGSLELADRDGSAPELLTKLQQIRFASYHEVLEVEPADTAYVIRQQHDRLSVTYSPQGWPGAIGEEDVPLLEEIGQGIQEAYSVLGIPEHRSAYEEALRRASGTV